MSSNYNDQVFINCPFDDRFLKIFRAICFTVFDCGFIPRCALELDVAPSIRLHRIINLIEQCRYGIHDLSRVEFYPSSRLPRFNMPFELGLFYSAAKFGSGRQKKKQFLILEKEKYRYQRFISDISGIDVTPHKNTIKRGVLAVRNWLRTVSRRTTIPPGEEIYSRYLRFQRDMKRICRQKGIDYESMPFVDLTLEMTLWLRANQVLHRPLFSSP